MSMGWLSSTVSNLVSRINNLVFRGYALRIKSTSGGLVAQIQGRSDEIRDDLLVLTGFGAGGFPLPADASGAPEALVFQLENGNRVLLPFIDRRHFANAGLDAPDTASIWNTVSRIRCLPDGTIEMRGVRLDAEFTETVRIKCGGLMTLEASEISADTSHLKVTGDITDSLDVGNVMTMNQMRYVYDRHVHSENDNGGPTDPPNLKMGG